MDRDHGVEIGQNPTPLQLEQVGGFDIAMGQTSTMQEREGLNHRQGHFGRTYRRTRGTHRHSHR